MAFVHLDEFVVMFGELNGSQNDVIGTLPVSGLASELSPSAREKFPKTTKKCRRNERKLRVFRSMGLGIGLPMTSIRRDA